MNKLAFVFPGQGSQAIGMSKDIYDFFPASRGIFKLAKKIFGYDIIELSENGNPEEIKKTKNAQPMIVTTSIAYFKALTEKGLKPDYLLGNSVGEFTGFLVSGIVSLDNLLSFVKVRSNLMTKCIPEEKVSGKYTSMLAILNEDKDMINDVCKEYDVEISNHNLGHYVLSGLPNKLQSVAEHLRSKKKVRSKPLAVEGPWHSRYMKPARDGLYDIISKAELNNPKIPYIANRNAQIVETAEQMRELTPEQVCNTVLWRDSFEKAISLGVNTFIECGYGNVESKMIARAYPNLNVLQKKKILFDK